MVFYSYWLLTSYNSSLCFCAVLNYTVQNFLLFLILLINLLERHFNLSPPLNMAIALWRSSSTLLCLFSFWKEPIAAHHCKWQPWSCALCVDTSTNKGELEGCWGLGMSSQPTAWTWISEESFPNCTEFENHCLQTLENNVTHEVTLESKCSATASNFTCILVSVSSDNLLS